MEGSQSVDRHQGLLGVIFEQCISDQYVQPIYPMNMSNHVVQPTYPTDISNCVIQPIYPTTYNQVLSSIFQSCVKVWIGFAALHLGHSELDMLVGDVLARMAKARDQGTAQLSPDQEISRDLSDLIMHAIFGPAAIMPSEDVSGGLSSWRPRQDSFSSLCNLTNVPPLFDCLTSGARVDLARKVLEGLVKDCLDGGNRQGGHQEELRSFPSHPVGVSSLISLCCIMANTVDALTIQGIKSNSVSMAQGKASSVNMSDTCSAISDETRQISALIHRIISVVDFQTDYEGQLKFYTECRGKFLNLEPIQVQLIHCALGLANKVLSKSAEKRSAARKRNPKVHGFLQASGGIFSTSFFFWHFSWSSWKFITVCFCFHRLAVHLLTSPSRPSGPLGTK